MHGAEVASAERERLTVREKADGSLVSSGDEIAAEMIAKYLEGRVITEEGTFGPESADLEWIVDPVDGTSHYASGSPLWGTIVAARRDGEIVAGAMYVRDLKCWFMVEEDKSFEWSWPLQKPSPSNPLPVAIDPLAVAIWPSEIPKVVVGDTLAHIMFAAGLVRGVYQRSVELWDIAPTLALSRALGGLPTNLTKLGAGEWPASFTITNDPELTAQIPASLSQVLSGLRSKTGIVISESQK